MAGRLRFAMIAAVALAVMAASAWAQEAEPRVVAGWDFEEGIGPFVAGGAGAARVELVFGPGQAAAGQGALAVHYDQVAGADAEEIVPLVWCPLGEPFPEEPSCMEFTARSLVAMPMNVVLLDARGAPYSTWVWLEPGEWRQVRLYIGELPLLRRQAGEATGPPQVGAILGVGLEDGIRAFHRSPPDAPVVVPKPRANDLFLDNVRLTTRQPSVPPVVCDPGREVPTFFALAELLAPVERVDMAPGQPAWRLSYETPPGKVSAAHWFTGPNLTSGTVGIELTLRSSHSTALVFTANTYDDRTFVAPVSLQPGEATTVRLKWADFAPAEGTQVVPPDSPRAGEVLAPEDVQDLVIADAGAMAVNQPLRNELCIGQVRLLQPAE